MDKIKESTRNYLKLPQVKKHCMKTFIRYLKYTNNHEINRKSDKEIMKKIMNNSLKIFWVDKLLSDKYNNFKIEKTCL